jgi:hypothetical protein
MAISTSASVRPAAYGRLGAREVLGRPGLRIVARLDVAPLDGALGLLDRHPAWKAVAGATHRDAVKLAA